MEVTATGATGPPSRPGVRAKGLERILLRRRVAGLRRWDVAPFFALFALIVGKALYHASRYQWCVPSFPTLRHS
jgi:hypothetical protein